MSIPFKYAESTLRYVQSRANTMDCPTIGAWQNAPNTSILLRAVPCQIGVTRKKHHSSQTLDLTSPTYEREREGGTTSCARLVEIVRMDKLECSQRYENSLKPI